MRLSEQVTDCECRLRRLEATRYETGPGKLVQLDNADKDACNLDWLLCNQRPDAIRHLF